MGRKRREFNLTLRFLVLLLAEVGKHGEGATLGKKSRVLFNTVGQRFLWEMLLFLYIQDVFD